MSTAEPDAVVFDAYGIPEKPPFGVRARRLLRQHPLGAFGFLIVLIVIFLAAVGPLIAGDAESISADILVGPSGEHWFGTDRLGRDYLARVIAGARLSMSLALGAMAIGKSPEQMAALGAFLPADHERRVAGLLAGRHPDFGRIGVRLGITAGDVVSLDAGPVVGLGILDALGESGRIGGGIYAMPVAPFAEALSAVSAVG